MVTTTASLSLYRPFSSFTRCHGAAAAADAVQRKGDVPGSSARIYGFRLIARGRLPNQS